jgi:hypothetical protein
MRQVVAMLRRVPPFVFFILSTLLFLLGAMSFNVTAASAPPRGAGLFAGHCHPEFG